MRRIATDRPATEVEVVRDIMSGSLFLTGSRVCGCRRSRSPIGTRRGAAALTVRSRTARCREPEQM